MKIPTHQAARPALLTVAILLAMISVFLSPAGSRAAEPDPFFGVMSQKLMTEDEWDTMEWGRLGSYRFPVDWGNIVRTAGGRYHWENLDNAVAATAERNIELLPVVYYTPDWLSADRRRLPLWGKKPIMAWRAFLKAIVLRYGTDGYFWTENPDVPVRPIQKWQIWNEPNIKYYAHPVSPNRYAKLIKISAGVIRNFDPQSKIVTAGFYSRPPKGKGIEVGRYLRRLYRVPGFASSFDIAAIHPYASSTRQSMHRTNPVRRVMNQHGNRKRRLMITELGWGSDSATIFGKGSREAQANQLESAYRTFLKHRSRLKLDAVYWFAWNDLPPESKTCAFCFQTGLFDPDGGAKPAWFRLLDFTHDL